MSAGRLERGRYLAIDALLSADELAGLVLSNRPAGRGSRTAAEVVFVADRFPARGDPLVEYARALGGARVEAAARPESPDVEVAGALHVDYREDDGIAARVVALVGLVARHPLRCRRRRRSAAGPASRRCRRSRRRCAGWPGTGTRACTRSARAIRG